MFLRTANYFNTKIKYVCLLKDIHLKKNKHTHYVGSRPYVFQSTPNNVSEIVLYFLQFV